MMMSSEKFVRAYVPRNIRNWLRSPTRSAKWVWDEIKYATKLNQVVEMRPGWSLLCHPAAYRSAYYAQNTDPEQVAEFDGFISTCRPEMVLFDIGAHFGLFSLAATHYGGVGAKAIAVDPSPTAARIIRIQAQLNRVADRLHIIEASVGEQTGWQSMVAVGVLSAGYFVTPSKDHPAGELTRVRAITLDELAQNFETSPTHIKIDVEGYEAAVLQGALQVLSQVEAPLLFIELHNKMIRERNGDPELTLALLESRGYKTFAVDGTPLDRASILGESLIRVIAKRLPVRSELAL